MATPLKRNAPFTPRSLLNLTQCHTFAALVEECSVTRASLRLELGQSTVSNHVKLIEEELGRPQFDRFQGGMIATADGLSSYVRMRVLLERAAFAFRHFASRSDAQPILHRVALPRGFPGTAIDECLSEVAAELSLDDPNQCLTLGVGVDIAGEPSISVSYGSEMEGGPLALPDTWLLVRSRADQGFKAGRMPLLELQGCRLLAPRLPTPLLDLIDALGVEVGAHVQHVDIEPVSLLAEAAQFSDFCTLMPAGLVNFAMLNKQFEYLQLEPSRFDPRIMIRATGQPDLAAKLRERLASRLVPDKLSKAVSAPTKRRVAPALSLKHSRSFIALYEEGNMGRAARRLCLVQPALTMQLHQIEDQLSCRLFERTARGLLATGLAHRLYALMHPIVEDFDAAIDEIRHAAMTPPLRVRVGLMPSLDDESITTESFVDALEHWQRAHGEGQLQVMEAFSEELLQWLQLRKIDFAIIDRKFADPLLRIEPVIEDSMAVVTDPRRGLLEPGPVSLKQLVTLPLVLPSNRHGLRGLISRHLADHGFTLEPRVEVDSMSAALRLVATGRYATILPLGAILKSSVRRHLTIHEIREPRIARHICIARSRREPCSQPVLDLMREVHMAFVRSAAALPELPGRAMAGISG